MTIRLALYAGLLAVLALVGYGLVLWGLYACAPPPLPGDDLWAFRQNAGEAFGLITHFGTKLCFTDDAGGAFALGLAPFVATKLLVVPVLMVAWEVFGRELRLAWFRSHGGHVVLAGAADDALSLARADGRFGSTVFLAPDRFVAAELARARPFAEILPIGRHAVVPLLDRLGAARARFVAAALPADLSNVAIAESVLAHPGAGELVVRLEQPAVRALSAQRLSQQAEAAGRPFSLVSLTQLQTRRGMIAAMPGHYTLDGDPRVHIAFCGSGAGLQSAVLEVARQGFGLERERPLLSILRTGSTDFAAGALERLMVSDAAQIQVATAFPGADGLDASAAAIAHDAPPLRAVHCVSDDPAEAEAMALRWEEILLGLGLPVPPIVAYTSAGRTLGATGMIRVAAAADLAEAHRLAKLREERARAVHQRFLDAQRAARGAAFGTAPAEVEWKDLPEFYREENRAVTDQMEDIKLSRVFMLARPGGDAATLSTDEVESLAMMAHARWLAARTVQGWKYGATRDNQRRLHPDIVPYAALDEPGKQKDRDEVASLVSMADLAGLSLKRERRVTIAALLGVEALDHFRNWLSTIPKAEVPVVVLPFDDQSLLPLAQTMLNDGVAIEAVVPAAAFAQPALAEVLRRAWRIHVANGRSANSALADRARESVTTEGAIYALA